MSVLNFLCVCLLNILCMWVRVLCVWLVSGEQKRMSDVLTGLLELPCMQGPLREQQALLLNLTCPSSALLFWWDTVWTCWDQTGQWASGSRLFADGHRNAWLTRIPGLPALTLRRVKLALPTEPRLYPHFSSFLGPRGNFFPGISASFSFFSSLPCTLYLFKLFCWAHGVRLLCFLQLPKPSAASVILRHDFSAQEFLLDLKNSFLAPSQVSRLEIRSFLPWKLK